MTSPSKLVPIPNELVAIVLSYTSNGDLPALRLACRGLCAAATPRFARVFFTHLELIKSVRSFEMLADICKHSVFGACVRSISMGSSRLLREGMDHCLEIWLGLGKQPYNNPQNRVAREQLLSYVRKLDEQRLFAGDCTPLTRALYLLRRHSNQISLGVHDNLSGSGLGSKSFYKDIPDDFWWMDRANTLKMVLDAGWISGYPVKELVVTCGAEIAKGYRSGDNGDRWNEVIKQSQLLLSHEEVEARETFLVGLSSIKLCLEKDREDGSPHYYDTLASLGLLLLYADKVNTVNLSLHDNLAALTKYYETEGLESLTLSNLSASEEEWTGFFRKHQRTLRMLELHDCTVWYMEQKLSGFLTWIKENLQLEQIVRGTFRITPTDFRLRKARHEECKARGGVVGVQEGLEDLISKLVSEGN